MEFSRCLGNEGVNVQKEEVGRLGNVSTDSVLHWLPNRKMIAILPKQMWSLAYLLIADEWCEKEKEEEKKNLGDNYESLLLFSLEKKISL